MSSQPGPAHSRRAAARTNRRSANSDDSIFPRKVSFALDSELKSAVENMAARAALDPETLVRLAIKDYVSRATQSGAGNSPAGDTEDRRQELAETCVEFADCLHRLMAFDSLLYRFLCLDSLRSSVEFDWCDFQKSVGSIGEITLSELADCWRIVGPRLEKFVASVEARNEPPVSNAK